MGVGSPPQLAGGKTLKTLPLVLTAPFSSFQRFAWRPRGRRPCSLREGCCTCDAVSPVAAPRGRRRGRNFENFEKGRGLTIFKVFKVSVPGKGVGRHFENFENGGPILFAEFPSPDSGPSGLRPGPHRELSPIWGCMTSRWERGRRPNKPAGGNTLKTCHLEVTPPFSKFSKFGLWAKGAATLLPSRRWLPERCRGGGVAAPRGRRQSFESFENCGCPAFFEVFKVLLPAKGLGGDILKTSNGGVPPS